MIEIPSLRPESRYGIPAADQLLFNREYIIGYSYLFRQPRWAMEVIDPDNKQIAPDFKRKNFFRPDRRVPEAFRADLADFQNSNHDRGHLISSADRRATQIENSETFLLSNMSPQTHDFNAGVWGRLEEAVRDLAASDEIAEVYVVCGPLFDVGKKIEVIGNKVDEDDKNEVVIPVPHAFFKSILAERVSGSLKLWSFILPHEASEAPLSSFRVRTTEVERKAGLSLWDRLRGQEAERLMRSRPAMWSRSSSRQAA